MQSERITIFAGHYGSGKTTLSIAHALQLAQGGRQVLLCDLDIVNPYFRTTDARDILAQAGVELIASPFANTNVDAPALPASAQAMLDRPGVYSVVDLGGDDRGSLALGRYAPQLSARGGYDMLLVLNQYRPLTRSLEGLAAIRQEIERAARLPFTGIVNNSNLGRETTLQDILSTAVFAREAAQALALPLRATAIVADLLSGNAAAQARAQLGPVLAVQPYTNNRGIHKGGLYGQRNI